MPLFQLWNFEDLDWSFSYRIKLKVRRITMRVLSCIVSREFWRHDHTIARSAKHSTFTAYGATQYSHSWQQMQINFALLCKLVIFTMLIVGISQSSYWTAVPSSEPWAMNRLQLGCQQSGKSTTWKGGRIKWTLETCLSGTSPILLPQRTMGNNPHLPPMGLLHLPMEVSQWVRSRPYEKRL